MRPDKLRLYHYWRSSSSWRVRWALAIKGIAYDAQAVDLLSGESESPEHLGRNPLGYVPVLEIPGQKGAKPSLLCESLAIIEWLDETYPTPPLLPKDPLLRAKARALAEVINSDTQPLQNLGPQYLHSDDPEERKRWAQHWIRNGLQAYEQLVQATAGKFSVGDTVTLPDLCLVPQCYNAKRYEMDLTAFPTVQRIETAALETEHCRIASPDRFQPQKP